VEIPEFWREEVQEQLIEGYRLSPHQKHLWLLEQQEAMAYRSVCAMRLHGPLDVARLHSAIGRVVARHEILRTGFQRVAGMKMPVQVINDQNGFGWERIDLSGVNAESQEAKLREIYKQEWGRSDEFDQGIVLRATLVDLAAEDHTLVLGLPALCADRWTLRNLADEICRGYGSADEHPDEFSGEVTQYLQFSEWQNEMVEGEDEVAERGRAYWRKQAGGAPLELTLPFEARPNATPTTPAAVPERVELRVDAAVVNEIEKLTAAHGGNVADVLVACWQALLWRLSGQAEVAVGYVYDGRQYEEMHQAAGLFAKAVPVRSEIESDTRFNDLLRQVTEAVGEAGEWQAYYNPESGRAEEEAAAGGAVGYEYEERTPEQHGGEVRFEVERQQSRTERFKLKLNCVRVDAWLQVEFEYDPRVYGRATVERMARHYVQLVTSAVKQPEALVGQLNLLTERERRQMLVEWNQTAAEYSRHLCVHQLFEAQVERTPEGVAVVFEDEQLTYRELNERANQLAHHLRARGVGTDVRVGIMIGRSVGMIVGVLGILKAGGAYVPLDPTYPQERLAFMLEDAAVPVLVTEQRLVESLPTSAAQVVCLDVDWQEIAEQNSENLNGGAGGESLAYVIYTSGSTGKPKGVMITHRGVVNYLSWCVKEYRVAEGCGTLLHSPLGFDLTVTSLFAPLLVGQRLVLIREDQGIDSLGSALRRDGDFSLIKLTPSHLEVLAQQLSATEVAGRTRALIIGGEALVGESISFWQRHAPETRIINEYGPTETVVGCCVYEASSGTIITGAVPIGRPIANTQLYVLDSHLNPLPIGVSGELYIGGDGVARGYLNRPELTVERFIPDPFSAEEGARLYKTGDLVRYLPDGNLEYLGRMDDQVKIRGFRIELGEIEAVLGQHDAVHDAVVVVREDEPGDKRLVAYVVADTDEAASAFSELRGFLNDKLPEYMVPSAYVVLDKIPLTSNGKVDRRALPVPDEGRPEMGAAYVAPRNALEEEVARVWTEVLRVERVGLHDNFFELGGHSLLVTQVVSRLRRSLGVELPLRSLFEAPTVASLASRIEASRQSDEGTEVPLLLPAPRDVELPLSLAQERLWFLNQLEPGSSAYNVPIVMRLVGRLNVAALRQTLNEIVARHEALRTTFSSVNGHPAQVITPTLDVVLPVAELDELPEREREVEAQRLIAEEAQRPFDLTRGPLVRARLLRLDEEEHVLILAMHHIVSDGWSAGVLFRELGALYEAFSAERESPLAELPIQYADYAVWQRKWLRGEVLEKQLAYWRAQLSGAQAMLVLPTDRPRPAVQSFRGAFQSRMLPKSLSAALNGLGRQEGVTLFMTLLAAFQTLLKRYSGQEDISVGTDVANRNRAEVEGLIGFFLNNLVIRTDLSGNPTFRELLKRVREVALEAYAHQEVPFNKLVQALEPERSLSHTPLFQVLFVLQNLPAEALKLKGLTLSLLEFDSGTSKFDLALFMEETEQGIVGTWVYKTDLFEAATITRMTGHFETLLESIVAQPDARLSALEMLTEAEKRQQSMELEEREESQVRKLKSARRKTVNLSQVNPVKTNYLRPEEPLPFVVQPNINDLDLADWAQSSREFIEVELQKHGAILFRGFDIKAVSEFERLALAICPELFGEYGDLPREDEGGKVYGSTPYPANQAILFHNESSHMHRWPMKIWFHCVTAAQQGGETPIVDCRKVYQRLSRQVRERFERHGVMYVRNYTNGLDVDWQEFFQTTDKAVVENYCHKAFIDFEWKNEDGLKTRQVCRAVAPHPKTGETVFFNQVQLHHISCLEPSVRASLLAMFREEDLPRNCYYGDGSPIEDSVMQEVLEVYRHSAVSFPWREGDILMLDNMLAAHGRNPFTGQRKIVVAMGEMIDNQDV